MIVILKTLHKKRFNQKKTHMIPVSTDPPNKKSKIKDKKQKQEDSKWKKKSSTKSRERCER